MNKLLPWITALAVVIGFLSALAALKDLLIAGICALIVYICIKLKTNKPSEQRAYFLGMHIPMNTINRKDIVAVNYLYIEEYPDLHGQNGKVVSISTDSVTVENAAGKKVVVNPEHLEVVRNFLGYSDIWADEALQIFKAILSRKSIQRYTGKDGWKRVKHPELISLDKLLECDYRVEPVEDNSEIITLNGKRYKCID